MTKVQFRGYFDYDGEQMAKLAVLDAEMEIPINVSLDEKTEQNLVPGASYNAEVWTNEYELSIHTPEESVQEVGADEPLSLIPCGTFPADPDDKDFKENGMIIFTGVVRSAEQFSRATEDEPAYKLTIEAYCLTFDLYYYGDEHIEEGYVLHGNCWLYGNLHAIEDKA